MEIEWRMVGREYLLYSYVFKNVIVLELGYKTSIYIKKVHTAHVVTKAGHTHAWKYGGEESGSLKK